MPRNLNDLVTLRHPDQPGVTYTTSVRSSESLRKRGWVEAKSSEAKAAVEANTSPDGEPPAPSQEETK